jgi:hypothetical protein
MHPSEPIKKHEHAKRKSRTEAILFPGQGIRLDTVVGIAGRNSE